MKLPKEETAPVTTRWIDGESPDPRVARAGDLLRHARTPEPLDEVRLRAVRARLADKPRLAQRRWVVQLAFGVAILLGVSTLVVAGTKVTQWIAARTHVVQAPVAPKPLPAPRKRHRRVDPTGDDVELSDDEPTEAVAPPARAEDPLFGPPPPAVAPMPPPAAHKRIVAMADPRPPHAPATAPAAAPAAPPPPSSALAEESALLSRALRVLRQDKDARGALALFDEHEARFPAGALETEARIGHTEALLQLGRSDEALALLDPMALPSKGRRRDLLVTRGELRARANRCAEALIDFGLVLSSETRDDAGAERALYGRATCRARLGDSDGARADLEAYLARFQTGRFVNDVRAMLRP